MSDEKKERWLSGLALTTVVLAVCATLSTFKGGSYSTRSVLSQSQAANQWAYYQSKSIKGYLYELRAEELEAQLATDGPSWPAAKRERLGALARDYRASVGRYEAEKSAIQAEAKRLESVRDHAQRHAQTFGMAVIFLQIAILICSISGLLKQRLLWAVGGLVGLAGIAGFLRGFFAG